MHPKAVWLPYEVADLDRAAEFYTVHLGLSKVDGWERGGERGVVLHVPGPAYVELVQPAPGATAGPRVAFALELADDNGVDAAHAETAQGPDRPVRFPRGHYGFTARDPDELPILIWSER